MSLKPMSASTSRAWGYFFLGAAIGMVMTALGGAPYRIALWVGVGLAVGGVILLISQDGEGVKL